MRATFRISRAILQAFVLFFFLWEADSDHLEPEGASSVWGRRVSVPRISERPNSLNISRFRRNWRSCLVEFKCSAMMMEVDLDLFAGKVYD